MHLIIFFSLCFDRPRPSTVWCFRLTVSTFFSPSSTFSTFFSPSSTFSTIFSPSSTFSAFFSPSSTFSTLFSPSSTFSTFYGSSSTFSSSNSACRTSCHPSVSTIRVVSIVISTVHALLSAGFSTTTSFFSCSSIRASRSNNHISGRFVNNLSFII